MSYVVYQITCSQNGKRYIGYTSKTAEERFATHIANAKWKRKTALCDAIRHYGPDSFEVSVLVECESHAEACHHEIKLILEMGTVLPNGYNMTLGGDGVPLTREQINAANAKKKGRFTEKQRTAALRRRGTKSSEETKAKLSAAGKGRKQSEDHVKKRSESFRRNRAKKMGIEYVHKEINVGNKPKIKLENKEKKVRWTAEAREAERQRALKQWTPEARILARERAQRQWTPEARQVARDRINARYAQLRAERESA